MRKDLSIHIGEDTSESRPTTTTVDDSAIRQAVGVIDPLLSNGSEPPVELLQRRSAIPQFIADAGEQASFKFLEFFASRIRNVGTRRAYYRNATRFCHWMETRHMALSETTSIHVAAYIEYLAQQNYAKPTIKQHLATIRELLDWLVVGQVIPYNPAAPVRGPKHIVYSGTTPVLSADDATHLLASIDTSHVVGSRDKALIATMVYTFGRVHAVLNMDIGDYFSSGKKRCVRLHEKNGNVIMVPVHHLLAEALDKYIDLAGGANAFPMQADGTTTLSARARQPLFRTTVGLSRRLTSRRMSQSDAWRMVQRRAKAAGINSPLGNHTVRATGITNFLQNGGRVEDAQKMAAHSSPRTTKLYDRRDEELAAEEIERIRIGSSDE